jgi:predicted MPP superfamily phosphohydrolase
MPDEKRSFAVFLSIVLGIWAAMHLYVFWRLNSIPWITAHVSPGTLALAATILWAGYPLVRMLNAKGLERFTRPLEFAATTWIGTAFLLFSALLVTDVFTLGGWPAPQLAANLRAGAVVVALALAVVALIEGLRPPAVSDYEVRLDGLPPEHDGLVLVAVSDLHLGTLLGGRWLAQQIRRIGQLRPQLVVIVGDLIDGEVSHVERLLPVLKTLRAPLGVWAVTGNHEYYAGVEESVKLLQAAGYNVLRDRNAEVVPGLILAGVDDLTARSQFGLAGHPWETALENRPPGATILLSHTPWHAQEAAAAGVGLMLSGHTHNGQLWPFYFLVRLRYKLMGGRYQIGGMTAIVCRGTGGWGPRMRLWRPAEILRITLRSVPQ